MLRLLLHRRANILFLNCARGFHIRRAVVLRLLLHRRADILFLNCARGFHIRRAVRLRLFLHRFADVFLRYHACEIVIPRLVRQFHTPTHLFFNGLADILLCHHAREIHIPYVIRFLRLRDCIRADKIIRNCNGKVIFPILCHAAGKKVNRNRNGVIFYRAWALFFHSCRRRAAENTVLGSVFQLASASDTIHAVSSLFAFLVFFDYTPYFKI